MNTTNTTYRIDTQHGDEITTGLAGYDHARRTAQAIADERRAAVYLSAEGDEASEEIEPTEAMPEVIDADLTPAETAFYTDLEASASWTTPAMLREWTPDGWDLDDDEADEYRRLARAEADRREEEAAEARAEEAICSSGHDVRPA